MSRILNPWGYHSQLFFTFFTEHSLALKAFAAALIGVKPEKILACLPGFGIRDHSSLCTRLILEEGALISLEIYLRLPSLSDFRYGSPSPKALSSPCTDEPALRPLLFSGSCSCRPLSSTQDFFPTAPLLRVFLVYQNPEQENPWFYLEFPPSDPVMASRFLNLAALAPPGGDLLSLYGFARLLLVSHSSELSALVEVFPHLSPIASLLERYLKERELNSYFCESGILSPAGSRGLSAMCSINRLLLRENRLTDLRRVSSDPAALAEIFREYWEKGLL